MLRWGSCGGVWDRVALAVIPGSTRDPGSRAVTRMALGPDFRQDDGGGCWLRMGSGCRRGCSPAKAGEQSGAPAFAGEQSCGAGGAYSYHPGGGRGPVGGRCQLRSALRYCGLSNWAPAFAGVVGKEAGSGLGSRGRERSGVWLWVLTLVRMTVGGVGHGCARSAVEAVLPRRRESSLGPAFAGEQSCGAGGVHHHHPGGGRGPIGERR